MAKKSKNIEVIPETTTISFETFSEIGTYEINNLTRENPTCFNGMVRIKKYKITIELIEESKDVYAKRLQKLWDESDNHHDSQPIESTAHKFGIQLQGSRGSKRKK